uniref:Uncharacterized protein n=1 Tax=Anguilla anguilla TaxID=7936 RepID=A0A0E9PU66_ANGAN
MQTMTPVNGPPRPKRRRKGRRRRGGRR